MGRNALSPPRFTECTLSVLKTHSKTTPCCCADYILVVGSETTREVSKPCDLSSRLSAVEKKGVKEDGAEEVKVLVHHDSVRK